MARILVTNDDGIDAPGLMALTEVLASVHDLVVVAPSSERSGSSCAISLHEPLRVIKRSEGYYAVDGMPADCTHLGLRKIMRESPPDFVLSGINRGPNLGDDTLFSGTVGAASVAALEGYSAIAVSMGDFREPMHYHTAARVVSALISRPDLMAGIKKRVLNINVPNLTVDQLKGIKETRLGKRYYPEHFDDDDLDPELTRYGRGPVSHDELEDSDVTAIEQHFVSMTLLKPHLLDLKAFHEKDRPWSLPAREELLI